MKIQNKLESIHLILALILNRFPEMLFKAGEEDKVLHFLQNYPAKYYAIRDKSKSGGTFKLKVPQDKVLQEIQGYTIYTINVSSYNYRENQILVGEIQVLSNGEIYLTVSTDKNASIRDAYAKPTFNLKTNIFDKTLNKIPGFDTIYAYISNHNLQDIIVEFALFNTNVGTNNEQVIIYELRTEY